MNEHQRFLSIVDSLHVARILGGQCHQGKSCAFGNESRVCAASVFSEAQCILSSGAFRNVQKDIGLLQTVIHFSEWHSHSEFRFTNLAETSGAFPGLEIPWLSTHTTLGNNQELLVSKEQMAKGRWTPKAEPKQSSIHKIFVQNRQRARLAEFAHLWLIEKRSEATGKLSDKELRNGALIVSDAELSFFSTIATLAAIGNEFEHWLVGGKAPSRLKHTSLKAKTENDLELEIGKNGADVYFFSSVGFDDSMKALGFLDLSGEVTERLQRLFDWIERKKKSPLFETPFASGCPFPELNGTFELNRVGLQEFLRTLNSWRLSVVSSNTQLFLLPDGVIRLCSSRFFLPGEYLLRSDESANRSYFAIPLGFAIDEDMDGNNRSVAVGAFALGTLMDFPGLDREEGLQCLSKLRTLLRTIAAFGYDRTLTSLVKNRIRELDRIRSLIDELKEVIDKGFEHPTPAQIKELSGCYFRDCASVTEDDVRGFKALFNCPNTGSTKLLSDGIITSSCFISFVKFLGFAIAGKLPEKLRLPGCPGIRFIIALGKFLEALEVPDQTLSFKFEIKDGTTVVTLDIPLTEAGVKGLSAAMQTSTKTTGATGELRKLLSCDISFISDGAGEKVKAAIALWDNHSPVILRDAREPIRVPLLRHVFQESRLSLNWDYPTPFSEEDVED